jgi:hypothetical protein
MKRRIVTSIDQRFYDSPDDFYKAFGLCEGMKRVMEVIGYIQLMGISPTGFSRQFILQDRLSGSPLSRKCFMDGMEANTLFRHALEKATVIVCEVDTCRVRTSSAAYLKCKFRRNGQQFGQLEFMFEEDGKEACCFGQYEFEKAA